ncbi:MAG: dual CXXC motif small (seleno)protein [Desulfovibrionaceae bacterium]
MAFSRVKFTPKAAQGLFCPDCGHLLTFTRSCVRAMFVCDGCGKSFDPSRFVDRLDEDFEEAYADVPINRM